MVPVVTLKLVPIAAILSGIRGRRTTLSSRKVINLPGHLFAAGACRVAGDELGGETAEIATTKRSEFSVLIRPEQPEDHAWVFALNVAAFESTAEAGLVDGLREQCDNLVSLVAVDGREIVGHILFSPATLECDEKASVFGLGPMAVAPTRQRQGIGTMLVEAGLDRCRKLGFEAVVVLGHPEFYPRFGFVPASQFDLDSDFPAPDEAFMALELAPGALRGKSGRVKYHPLFSDT